MKKNMNIRNFLGHIFAILVAIIFAYVISGTIYVNLLYLADLEHSYYLYIPILIVVSFFSVKYRKDIVMKFAQSKKRKNKKLEEVQDEN